MEAANLPKNDEANPTGQTGALIVQNGRHAGARRPLAPLTTSVGRAPNCDIRLNVDGVDPLHCLLADTPQGVQLRDLNSGHGTFVNGNRVSTAMLQDGDLIKVGPFQFRLDRPAPLPAPHSEMEPVEEPIRQSMRIQTSCGGGQQIALDEEEARLEQRRQDLQRQEQQLAAHLEERQHQVQLWSDFTRSEKELLRQDRHEFEKAKARQDEEVAQAQNRVGLEQRQAKAERQRIDKIYQRLKKRWKIHWGAEKEKYQQLARVLQDEVQRIEAGKAALEDRRADFGKQAARVQAEQEQSRQHLVAQRGALTEDQERWRRRCALERQVLRVKEREIDEAFGKLKHVRRLIQADKDAWAHQQGILQKELLGLNHRVVNHRIQLQQLESAIAERAAQIKAAEPFDPETEIAVVADGVVPGLPFALPVDDAWHHREAALGILLGELSDQRHHLLEQFERLAAMQEAWRLEREAAADELEALSRRLIEREELMSLRDQQLVAQQHRSALRRDELEGFRYELQAWRDQLAVRESAFQEESAKQLGELQARETSLEEQLASLAEMRQRWTQRRRRELARQESARAHLDAQQKQVDELRAVLFANRQEVELEKRQLAEKSLALEQYRQELFTRADDPNAQNRIERLRRRWLSINADLIRNAKVERESARKEIERLDQFHAQLASDSARLDLLDNDLAEKQCLLDERDANLKALQAKLRHDEPRAESDLLRISEETGAAAIDQAA